MKQTPSQGKGCCEHSASLPRQEAKPTEILQQLHR